MIAISAGYTRWIAAHALILLVVPIVPVCCWTSAIVLLAGNSGGKHPACSLIAMLLTTTSLIMLAYGMFFMRSWSLDDALAYALVLATFAYPVMIVAVCLAMYGNTLATTKLTFTALIYSAGVACAGFLFLCAGF